MKTAKHQRSGLAIILVMGVIAMTLAMSYALMRSQFLVSKVHENATRHGNARQAATAGLTHAMRVMHNAESWEGVGSTIQGQLSSDLRFEVTYSAGDPSLNPANQSAYPDRDYNDYAYRVTLDATGYAVDADNPDRETSHKMRAVVRLVPRKLSTSEPEAWSAINEHTVYQWNSTKTVIADLPFRIEGTTHLKGELELAENYPYDAKPFDGLIDEVAIFSSALTAEQLLEIYDDATGTSNGSADKLGDAYNLLTPTHWWRLDETAGATSAVDAAGGANGAINHARMGATAAPGTSGTSAEFRGRHDAIDLGNIEAPSTALTICAWFKADSYYTEGRIISKAKSSANEDHYWMLSTYPFGGEAWLRFRLKAGGTTSTVYGTGGRVGTGEWVFVAATYDGARMRLYQNGVQVGSDTKSGTVDTNSLLNAFIGDNPPGSSRSTYLADLERMRIGGLGDHRPFGGTLSLGDGLTSDDTIDVLTEQLNTTVDATLSASTSNPISHPGTVTTYQIYQGGPTYSVPQIATSLSAANIAPEPVNNPLGVYRDSGADTNIYADTSFQGVLLFDGLYTDIKVRGNNVSLSSVRLPAFDDGTVYELPLALAEGDFLVESNGGGTINGFVMAWDKMSLAPGTNQTLDVTGRVVTRKLSLKGPTQWASISESTWNWLLYLYRHYDQLTNSEIPADYFPEWLREFYGADYNDRLTVKPDESSPNYHWHDWQNPIIVPHPDDPGLRWDLVEWIDSPAD